VIATGGDHDAPSSGADEAGVRPPKAQTRARRLLWLGLGLTAVQAGVGCALWLTDPDLGSRVAAVTVAAFVGGRMPGILAGLELGLGGLATATLNIALNTCWLLLALEPLERVATGARSWRPLRRLVRDAERRAGSMGSGTDRIGALALAVFVWLPTPGTGAIVGAAIGLVMGMGPARMLPLVLGSMWLGIVSWTYGVEALVLFTGDAGRVIAWVATIGLLAGGLVGRPRRQPEEGPE
jgi:uncharacterized membrane protein